MIPSMSNFAAIDLFDKRGMYQVTCSVTHPIKAANAGFMALAHAGIEPFEGQGIGFFFCVPPASFDDFSIQNVVASNDQALASGDGWHRDQNGTAYWTQWALLIDL